MKKTLAAAAALAASAILAACNSTGGGGGSKATGSATSGPVTIGVVFPSLENSYLVTVKNAIDAEAKKEHAKVLFQAPQSSLDTEGAINALTNITSQRPDVILAFISAGAPLVPALNAAARVAPVILLDTDVPTFTNRTSYIGTDNGKAAGLAGTYLAQQLKSGTVGLLTGTPGNATHQARADGFTAALKGSSVTIAASLRTDCDAVKGRSATEDLLTSHPDVKGIFAICDDPMQGAVKAVQAKHLKNLLLVGFDASPAGLANVKSGAEAAEVAQFPAKIGQLGVVDGIRAARGQAIPKYIDSGEQLVTKDNVDQFMASQN